MLETKLTVNEDLNFDEKIRSGYFIPFKPSLTKLLNIIPQNVKLNFSNNLTSFKTDIFDGKYIQDIIDSKSNKNQLVFLIYCDDLELVNPIGSQRTKHKISL